MVLLAFCKLLSKDHTALGKTFVSSDPMIRKKMFNLFAIVFLQKS